MMNYKKIVMLLLFVVCSINFAFSQGIDPEVLKKAQQMGLSEKDIKSKMANQGDLRNNKITKFDKFNDKYYEEESINEMRFIDSLDMEKQKYIQELILKKYKEQKEKEIDSLQKLKTFGYDIFKKGVLSYEPNMNIATPRNYTLTGGDEVLITIWGDTELLVKEVISPDGIINIPNYGPVNIAGITVEKAKAKLINLLSKTYSSLGSTSELMLSVGQIGSIKVNVTGEAEFAGSYTVPSLATLFHVLHLCGGTTEIGDLRSIKVYRSSQLVANLDIYDFILKGNTKHNVILKDGDVIVIKPYKSKVYVSGQIKRQMFYQMRPDETVSQLLDCAGGFGDMAYRNEVKLYRKNGAYKEIISVKNSDFGKILLIDGDSLVVDKFNNEFKNILTIKGAVWRPGDFQLTEETKTLSSLIQKAGGLMGDAFATRGIITRRNDDYTKSILNFVTRDVVTGKADVELKNFDKIYIPKLDSMREKFYITVFGEVNKPDTLEYQEGMRIEDAIILAGGLKESASLATLDVARRIKNPSTLDYSDKISNVMEFNINEDLTLTEATNNFVLQKFDQIIVRRSPQYQEQKKIFIMGEVMFPGDYTLTNNKTYLSDVIKMAKGVTPEAYVKGTSLTRQIIKEVEEVKYDEFGNKIENVKDKNYFTESDLNDLTINKLKNSILGKDTLIVNNQDIRFFPIGIDMEKALAKPHSNGDVVIKENDIIFVPKVSNIVNVVGAVYYPNATSFETKKLKHYIKEGGGYSKNALKKPFVIYANGKVKTTRSFIFKSYPCVEPGCMIVVPMKNWKNRMSFGETMGLVTGMTSMASSLATLGVSLGTLKK